MLKNRSSGDASLHATTRLFMRTAPIGAATIRERAPSRYLTLPLSLVCQTALCILLVASTATAQTTLKVRLKPSVDATIDEMPLERYVAAVVAGEAGSFRSDEALRAMSVAIRTYAVRFRGRHSTEGFDLCGSTHCQRLEPSMVTPRIQAAVDATAGELMWYRGVPILAPYSRDCGGRTEDVAALWPGVDAAYLRSHSDPYCVRGGPAEWRWTASPEQIVAALGKSGLRAPQQLTSVVVTRRTESGRAREVALAGAGETVRVAAGSFRLAIGRALGFATVRGEWWESNDAGGRIEFHGRGEGHGVGMCQRGSERMGAEGKSWREILAFYYPGSVVAKTASGLQWTRLGGEAVALFSTQPDRDRVVLGLAERLAPEIAARTGLSVPSGIEVRVYPDVDSFRNGTGEPGWVAAHTAGRRVELQPVYVLQSRGALESILRHEVTHVLLETTAAPGLPIWFREGLAGYLSGGEGINGQSTDGAIAQRASQGQAREANRAAVARVAALIHQHGLPAVIGWLRAGLPR